MTSQQALSNAKRRSSAKAQVSGSAASSCQIESQPQPQAAAGFDSVWQELAAKLPTGKSPEEKQKRDILFKKFDPNGNGYLSLAEIDAAMKKVLDCDALFDAKQVTMRAYQAAKDANKGDQNTTAGDDFVDKKEFRLLLQYLRDYFELHVIDHF